MDPPQARGAHADAEEQAAGRRHLGPDPAALDRDPGHRRTRSNRRWPRPIVLAPDLVTPSVVHQPAESQHSYSQRCGCARKCYREENILWVHSCRPFMVFVRSVLRALAATRGGRTSAGLGSGRSWSRGRPQRQNLRQDRVAHP